MKASKLLLKFIT